VRSRTSRRSRRNGATGRKRIVLTPTVAPLRRSRSYEIYTNKNKDKNLNEYTKNTKNKIVRIKGTPT
jgi:hypothetical protein